MSTPPTPHPSAAAGRGTAVVRPARPDEAAEVAWLAAVTFPLACPPGTKVPTMAAHIGAHLHPAAFRAWARSDRHALLVAEASRDAPAAEGAADLLGYALVELGEPAGEAEREVLSSVCAGPYAELSKIYVLPDSQGSGLAGLLMEGAIAAAHGLDPAAPLWLGTNGENRRAQAFYRKHRFEVVGGRTYDVGGVQHDDVVMLRR